MKILTLLLLSLSHNTARSSPDTDVTKIQQGYEWLDNRHLRGLASAGELWCTTYDLEEMLESDLSDLDFALPKEDSNGVVEVIAPDSINCLKSSTERCPAAVYSNIPDYLHGTEAVKPPNYDPTIHNELCTQCSFDYPEDTFTFTAPCIDFECADTDANSVTVHYKVSRSDLYRTTQHTERISYNYGTGYTCVWEHDQKLYKVDYLEGVTNARSTTLVIENRFNHGNIDPTPGVVDSCEYLVDDVKCSSCQICGDYEPGFFALDCSNIRAGAVSSCSESVVNPFLGYFPKLFVVQNGYTPAPTSPPTDSSDSYDDSGTSTRPLVIAVCVILVLILVLVCFGSMCKKDKE